MSKKRENLWKELSRPIYVGDRLQANLTGIRQGEIMKKSTLILFLIVAVFTVFSFVACKNEPKVVNVTSVTLNKEKNAIQIEKSVATIEWE